MTKVQQIFDALCQLAPLSLQMEFDNSGFLVGRSDKTVDRALLALDITDWVVDEAIADSADLIISHHPLIFDPLRSVSGNGNGAKVLRLAENGISAICMHTNLDIARGGVNDVLMQILGATVSEALDAEHCGRVGFLEEAMDTASFLALLRSRLGVNGLRYVDSGRPIRKLAVLGGAGGSALGDAIEKQCDCFVTADIKYHQFLEAAEKGITLIDADHFCTENPVMIHLTQSLAQRFPDVEFSLSRSHGPVIRFA